MAALRDGSRGNYFGSLHGESEPLTFEEMKSNAFYIWVYLLNKGWSVNAIAGMLGNLQAESTINPGRWQSDNVGNVSGGYGLVQWTPSTKYTSWCADNGFSDPSEMDANLERILYEVANEIQWIPTSSYDMTFSEFTVSTATARELGKAFLLNYERPADQSEEVQVYREYLAEVWYNVLTGGGGPVVPDEPTGTKNKKKKYNFVLFGERRRKLWTNRNF